MSTKGLMAHKKVAAVTIHPEDAGKVAGKAATLTLKEPWLYQPPEGEPSRGPFKLRNVDHGHEIVKAAYDERFGPKATSTRKEGLRAPTEPKEHRVSRGAAIEPDYAALPAAPPEPVAQFTFTTLGGWIYRYEVHSEEATYRVPGKPGECVGHEIAGWFIHPNKKAGKEVEKLILAHAQRWMAPGYLDTYVVKVAKVWTVEIERAAKAANEMVSPWCQMHLILGDPKEPK